MTEFEDLDLSKLKLPELRTMCKENGLPSSGNKNDLIQRLETLYQKDVDEDDLLGVSTNEDELLNDDSNINEEDVLGSLELEEEDKTDKLKPVNKRTHIHLSDPSEEQPLRKRQQTETPIIKVQNESQQKKTDEPSHKLPHNASSDDPTDPKLSRAERFGLPSANTIAEKKAARAERFGTSGATSVENKKAARAQRFGMSSGLTEEKKLARAERFGVSLPNAASTDSKLASRAERFGLKNNPSSESQIAALKKREERFGQVVSPVLSKLESEDKKKTRLERFTDSSANGASRSSFEANKISFEKSDSSAKKDERAKRFGIAVK